MMGPKRARELLNAWAEGQLWGLLYRAALGRHDGGPAVMLDELRNNTGELYVEVLQVVGSWRHGEVWAVLCGLHGQRVWIQLVKVELWL